MSAEGDKKRPSANRRILRQLPKSLVAKVGAYRQTRQGRDVDGMSFNYSLFNC